MSILMKINLKFDIIYLSNKGEYCMNLNFDVVQLKKEMDLFFKREDCENILKQYRKYHVKIKYNDENMYVLFNRSLYIVGITDNSWYLFPYKDSYFTTSISFNGMFDMILMAMKDNEEIHKKEARA